MTPQTKQSMDDIKVTLTSNAYESILRAIDDYPPRDDKNRKWMSETIEQILTNLVDEAMEAVEPKEHHQGYKH